MARQSTTIQRMRDEKYATARVKNFLAASGLTFPSTDSMVSTSMLAKALRNEKFLKRLERVARLPGSEPINGD